MKQKKLTESGVTRADEVFSLLSSYEKDTFNVAWRFTTESIHEHSNSSPFRVKTKKFEPNFWRMAQRAKQFEGIKYAMLNSRCIDARGQI